MTTNPNREKANAYMREWRKRNPEKKRAENKRTYLRVRSQTDVETRRFAKYHITKDDFILMIDRQGGCCAICKTPGDWQSLVVDHDHACCVRDSCGKCVRGALCKKCNTALGWFGDSAELLISALRYVR